MDLSIQHTNNLTTNIVCTFFAKIICLRLTIRCEHIDVKIYYKFTFVVICIVLNRNVDMLITT